jgi:nitrite reductase (NADH) small subunit
MTEHAIGSIAQIPPGEGREFTIAETKIAVFHLRDGTIRATQAECPHKKGPLADGLTGNGIVVCPYHAWKFELATGLPVFGDCGIQTYEVRSDGETLWVRL